ncbi:Ig-like domain-containing protein [Alloalcanivorax marinus]|uniref:Ig-like domain-containing protein n=1 Tax=Alloalcanivorax marinus TaxID=1177169 RepID=UPI001932FD06|nr:Ig-like domain-containing protein [Alloalcanivorax marinus]
MYAYPGDGQSEVSTAAPVILRFSASVGVADAAAAIRLYEGDADGREMTPNFEEVQGESGNVMIVPEDDDPFKPNQQYTLVIDGLTLANGGAVADRTLRFSTRALHQGPKELVVTDMDNFEVIRAFPNFDNLSVPAAQQGFAAMDFSSFRLQMSQPVDRDTAVYGESVTLTHGADDEQVPATLLVDGRYLTIDPEPEYLDPTQTYTLTLGADLASIYGVNFDEQRLRFKPQDTSPRGEPTRLVQRLTVGGQSRLTGRDVNQVPVNGTLLGEDANITQARAESVVAELADATRFAEITPIRLPKGTVLRGDEISPIMIGGEVAAGFGSGDVTMTLLSDATGYMMENRYSVGDESASRMIQLMMDVGIATEEARANGAFTQDLLHIELVGLADIDTDAGVLNVDAVSVVEPDILGQEFGYGLLSFQLQSYEDQGSAPTAQADTVGPTLQSWMPGDKTNLQKPGDPIVLNFDEPLAPRSVAGKVTLYKTDNSGVAEQPIDVMVDGASVVVRPREPLRLSEELNPIQYRIQVASGVTDLAGNALAVPLDETFELATRVEELIGGTDNFGEPVEMVEWSPVITSLYPGYPCVLDESTRDIANGLAGRCLGGFTGITAEQYPDLTLMPADIQPADDVLPISQLPANRPVIVRFSKDIDPSSVVYGSSFVVEELDDSGNVVGEVQGDITLGARDITFWPASPWQEGGYYQYTLGSNGDWSSSDAQCGDEAICGVDGLPLQTRQLAQVEIERAFSPMTRATYVTATTVTEADGGGEDLTQIFQGASETHNVLQSLVNLPTADVNANFEHEMNHTVEETGPNATGFTPFEYAVQEPVPGDEPDPYTDPAIDPDGVRPLPNSAKILVRTPGGLPNGQAQPPFFTLNSGTVGCGFNYPAPADQTPDSVADPLVCPKEKFTYLTAALNAEVTDEFVEGQGLKVLIWPGRILTTSFRVYQNLNTTMVPVPSGLQIMRMRYQEDGNGQRNQPIEAWIKDGADGPVLSAENVDLYLDAPFLERNLFGLTVYHNIYSYPVTMSLSGDVKFLDDGRMVVEQFNTEDVPVDVKFFANVGFQAGFLDLLIPQRGSFISYVSSPIK